MRSWAPTLLGDGFIPFLKTQIQKIQSEVYEICISLGWRRDHILGIVGEVFKGSVIFCVVYAKDYEFVSDVEYTL